MPADAALPSAAPLDLDALTLERLATAAIKADAAYQDCSFGDEPEHFSALGLALKQFQQAATPDTILALVAAARRGGADTERLAAYRARLAPQYGYTLIHEDSVVRPDAASHVKPSEFDAIVDGFSDAPPALHSDSSEVEQLRGVVWALADTLGKRCLADANRDREAPNDWPGGQEWNDLVGTSHSIMRRRGYAEAGLDAKAVIALLCDRYGTAKPFSPLPPEAP